MVMKATQSQIYFYIRQMFSLPVKYNVNKQRAIKAKYELKLIFV